jgi:hypothetical protein
MDKQQVIEEMARSLSNMFCNKWFPREIPLTADHVNGARAWMQLADAVYTIAERYFTQAAERYVGFNPTGYVGFDPTPVYRASQDGIYSVAGKQLSMKAGQTVEEALAAIENLQRCAVCDWPLAKNASDGCVAGNCSYRPPEGTDEFRRVEKRRRALESRLKVEPAVPGSSKP